MRLSNDRYEKIKRKVVGFIKECGIRSYPIDIKNICEKLGCKLLTYSMLDIEDREFVMNKSEDGYILTDEKGIVGICYNDLEYYDRITTTIAHEIGHYVLGHKEHSALAESEADFFAVYLLTPNPILYKYGVDNELDLCSRFKVSMSLGMNSWNRFVKWRNNMIRFNLSFKDYEEELYNLID